MEAGLLWFCDNIQETRNLAEIEPNSSNARGRSALCTTTSCWVPDSLQLQSQQEPRRLETKDVAGRASRFGYDAVPTLL
jgi:hypothetical protein